MKWILGLLLVTSFSNGTFASERQMIKSLGVSPKGQFVAIEEYGYDSNQKTYFSRIKFMNVWKKTYVAPHVVIEREAFRPDDLERVRQQAIKEAKNQLKKLQIELST